MLVFLAYFVTKPDTDQFRVAELLALAKLANVASSDSLRPSSIILGADSEPQAPFTAAEWSSFSTVYEAFQAGTSPLLYIALPSAQAAADLVSRGCLIRSIYAVAAPHATCVEALVASLTSAASPLFTPLSDMVAHPVIRYEVDSIERKCPLDEKTAIIKQFNSLGHQGRTDLYDDAATRFVVFLLHDRATKTLRFAFHAMLIATSTRLHFLDHYSLKTRRYIGTTSMPPELTFLMANLALVTKNAFVLDPFAGTGGTLVSAAHFGASTLGFDMDGRVLRDGAIVGEQALQDLELREAERRKKAARTGDAGGAASAADMAGATVGKPSFRQNFVDYRLQAADACRLNFSVADSFFAAASARRGCRGFIDAIVSDPPYGIREQQRKVAPLLRAAVASGAQASGPRLAKYDTGDLMLDLVLFAAHNLVLGGHLVYWHPTVRATYTPAEIPSHPALALLWNIEQPLSIKVSRRLVVMRKVAEVPESEVDIAAIHAAMKSPDNVRQAMDAVTEGPEVYLAYREKRAAIRDSHLQWRQEQGLVAPPLSRSERREVNMNNRARKAEEKERKQALFHVKKDASGAGTPPPSHSAGEDAVAQGLPDEDMARAPSPGE